MNEEEIVLKWKQNLDQIFERHDARVRAIEKEHNKRITIAFLLSAIGAMLPFIFVWLRRL